LHGGLNSWDARISLISPEIVCHAPELDFGKERVLVLKVDDPFLFDDFPVSEAD